MKLIKKKMLYMAVLALLGAGFVAMGLYHLASDALPRRITGAASSVATAFAVLLVALLLAVAWNPLGPERGFVRNAVFVGAAIGGLLGLFFVFQRYYARLGLHEIGRHYRFRIKAPAPVAECLDPNIVGIEYLYCVCMPEQWAHVQEQYEIITRPPLEPHLCVGYEIRF